MNRRKEVVDNEVSHVLAEALSSREVKAEVDSGKYSAQGRLLGCGGEAAKRTCRSRKHFGGDGKVEVVMVKDGVQNGRGRSANDGMRSRIGGIWSGSSNLWQPVWIGYGFRVVICIGLPDRGNWPPEVVDVLGVVEGYYRVGQAKVDQGKQPRALCGAQPIR